jgi:hypothetical protein
MPPVRFEPTIPASARQQTYALERAATGPGSPEFIYGNIRNCEKKQELCPCETGHSSTNDLARAATCDQPSK